MHQILQASTVRGVVTTELPPPEAELFPGVQWGRFDVLFTPAFWAGRAWLAALDGEKRQHRLGSTLREEVAACLLGGFGIPAEIGLAAFARVRDRGLLRGKPTLAALEAALREPLSIGGRTVRYRFASQRARYLATTLDQVDDLPTGDDDVAFRDSLTSLPGVGLKTASWITRNVRDSDAVAILDVHVCRACVLAGVFPTNCDVARRYRDLEKLYLAFASAIAARPSVLDALIWELVRRVSSLLVRPTVPDRSRGSATRMISSPHHVRLNSKLYTGRAADR